MGSLVDSAENVHSSSESPPLDEPTEVVDAHSDTPALGSDDNLAALQAAAARYENSTESRVVGCSCGSVFCSLFLS
jgi:hypothetical protein